MADQARARLLEDLKGTVFKDRVGGDHPIRGPHGEAIMELKAKAVPVEQRMFQIQGGRKAAWVRLTDEIIRDGKIEPGVSPWSSPSFPVPKKNQGSIDWSKISGVSMIIPEMTHNPYPV